jgi:hypothetical protein
MAGLCEASCVPPYTAHASNVVCEEDHGSDPAAIATASYPEWAMLEAWLDFHPFGCNTASRHAASR